jgi:hypothetical protein
LPSNLEEKEEQEKKQEIREKYYQMKNKNPN